MSRRVAAIVWEGSSDVAMHGEYGGLVGLTPAVGLSSHYGRVSTDLAAALSPPPAPPSRGGLIAWIVGLLVLAGCLARVVAVADDHAAESSAAAQSAWLGYTLLMAPIAIAVALLTVLLVRRLRSDHRWRRAMPEMGAVWDAAKYCGRCAVAYFPRPAIPSSLPDHIDPGSFQDLVWQAGFIRHRAGAR